MKWVHLALEPIGEAGLKPNQVVCLHIIPSYEPLNFVLLTRLEWENQGGE